MEQMAAQQQTTPNPVQTGPTTAAQNAVAQGRLFWIGITWVA